MATSDQLGEGSSSRACVSVGCPNQIFPPDKHLECMYCLTDEHIVPLGERICEVCVDLPRNTYKKRLIRRSELLRKHLRSRPSSEEESHSRGRKRGKGVRVRSSPPRVSDRSALLRPEQLAASSGILPPQKGDPGAGA